MAPAGAAKVAAAKRDGSWTMLDAVEALEVPSDLAGCVRTWPAALEEVAGELRQARA